MIDFSTVANCLEGLVGFRNSDRTCISDFTNTQTGATSTVYVTDESGITPTNITASTPKDYSSIPSYVADVLRSSTVNTVQEFINRHKELTRARTLIDNINPVKSHCIITNQITKSGRFVGIMLEPRQSDSIASIIAFLGVQFNTLNPNLMIYLYETSQNDAIATMRLPGHNKMLSLQWFASTMIARYRSNTGGTGQRFLLGYYEDDLLGNAVSTPMQTNCCAGTEWVSQYQKHIFITGVSISASGLNIARTLPNVNLIGEGDETFGIHLRFYVTCEISDVICDNKNMFAMAISKKCAMKFYQDFANNTNLSREADMTRDRALTNYAMAKEEYDGLLRSIRFDFTDIDKNCLPCSQRDLRSSVIM